MQFNDKHSFDKPSATVLKMFSDRAYFERKYKELGFSNVEVLECTNDGRKFRIKARYSAPLDAPLPDFAKKFFAAANVITQSDTWDLEKKTGRLEAEIRGVPVKVGDGLQPDVLLGPLNNKMQFDRVNELIADAQQAGGRCVTGGKAQAGGGYFIEPTLVTGLKEGARLVDEEQFGPALPIVTYTSVDDAIERANATMYGLAGSVWSANVERAAEIAGQLDTGSAWVNQHLAVSPVWWEKTGQYYFGQGLGMP